MEAISAALAMEEPNLTERAHPSVIEYPLDRSLGACALIHGFLSVAECKALIAQAEQRGFASAELDYPPSYRNNDRQVVDDQDLANQLLSRLADIFNGGPESLLKPSLRKEWQLQGINERIRLCKYQPRQQFRIHQDGVHHRGPDCRSMLTFMVYLTDGDEFKGGDTLFYAAGPAQGESERNIVARVRPKAGSVILFDHGVWHAGEVVTNGTKYILRSDILFQRKDKDTMASPTPPRHEGYVWTLAALSDGRLASGGRDGSIRLWNSDGSLDGTLAGHTQSVLGLTEVEPGVLASISRDRTLRFWATTSGRNVRTVAAHQAAVLSIAPLSDQLLATGGADHSIELWSERGEHLRTFRGHSGWIWGLAAVGDELLASASEDGTVRIWNIRSAQCKHVRHLPHPLRCVDTRPAIDASTLATGDANGTVTLWTLDQEGLSVTQSFMAHSAAVRRVRFLRNGMLATCGEDNFLRIWNTHAIELVHEEVRANFVTDVIELGSAARISCGYDGELAWSGT